MNTPKVSDAVRVLGLPRIHTQASTDGARRHRVQRIYLQTNELLEELGTQLLQGT